MSEGQYTRKMNEKLSEDNCMNVAEIFSKKNEICQFDGTRTHHESLKKFITRKL